MAAQGQQPDPNDPVAAASASLAQAKAAADEMAAGTASQTKLDQDRAATPALIAAAQANLYSISQERTALQNALAQARADLTNCQTALAKANESLAGQSKLPNGQALPPGTYVSAKSALAMATVAIFVGAGGGAIATKVILDNEKKKKENGTSLEKTP